MQKNMQLKTKFHFQFYNKKHTQGDMAIDFGFWSFFQQRGEHGSGCGDDGAK